ncbi:MAG: ABC transporter ATP-binding protein [Candidatus Tectomicrobia bacterium]|nr:ABC transporter ATP-binding protein [Candidatus Tectomicrobia bacterium]
MPTPLLQVDNLRTHFFGFRGQRAVKAVDGVSFSLEAGQTLGLVGESGCGKTTTCHSIFRILPPGAEVIGGSVTFAGEDLMQKSPRDMRRIRGRDMAMILQDPMASLNPLFTIFDQVAEPAYFHLGLRRQNLRSRVAELLHMVRIPSPDTRMHEYPHQMSGGMRQRIVGATALAGGPKLIIADEPTTNLDVTIQLQYLNLLKDLQRQTGVALIFVTHDLGIVAKMCDRVAVMYAGKIVEQGSVRTIYNHPQHPYTEGLIKSVPRIGSKSDLYAIPGQPPDLANLPPGCAFAPRCREVMALCCRDEPEEIVLADGHRSRCWLPVQEGIDG